VKVQLFSSPSLLSQIHTSACISKPRKHFRTLSRIFGCILKTPYIREGECVVSLSVRHTRNDDNETARKENAQEARFLVLSSSFFPLSSVLLFFSLSFSFFFLLFFFYFYKRRTSLFCQRSNLHCAHRVTSSAAHRG
jgi:hypothetical protein